MKIVNIKGQIELLSGLHIGGGDDTMKIGGIDNGVIKDINTDKPYIPGSSLKGKMRSLLEWHIGVVGIGDGNPFSSKLLNDSIFNDDAKKNYAQNLLKLFGDKECAFGITRISVGDCSLSQETVDKELKLSEAKYENVIDRQTGTASNPRQTERVPAGVKFDFDIRVKVLDDDNGDELVSMVKQGLDLVANDYLGGSGSRGYGRVKFHIED
ncbi:type III-A CRISPR-associated RAMP protein Csm3 [Sulfurimonas sp. NW15]|uniref:type III-A CRISPR-associated RAMP protein Csm3 n=1 Tax=Sulfurimonas sp. NW15 TaxID=2922729 RepID=UPI003DA9E941